MLREATRRRRETDEGLDRQATAESVIYEVYVRVKGHYEGLTRGQSDKLLSLCNRIVGEDISLKPGARRTEAEKDDWTNRIIHAMNEEWAGDAKLTERASRRTRTRVENADPDDIAEAEQEGKGGDRDSNGTLYIYLIIFGASALFSAIGGWRVGKWDVTMDAKPNRLHWLVVVVLLALHVGVVLSLGYLVIYSSCQHKSTYANLRTNSGEFFSKSCKDMPIFATIMAVASCIFIPMYLPFPGRGFAKSNWNVILRFVDKMYNHKFELLRENQISSEEKKKRWVYLQCKPHIWAFFFYTVLILHLTYGSLNLYVWHTLATKSPGELIDNRLMGIGCKLRD